MHKTVQNKTNVFLLNFWSENNGKGKLGGIGTIIELDVILTEEILIIRKQFKWVLDAKVQTIFEFTKKLKFLTRI